MNSDFEQLTLTGYQSLINPPYNYRFKEKDVPTLENTTPTYNRSHLAGVQPLTSERLWGTNNKNDDISMFNKSFQSTGYLKPSLDQNGYFDPRVQMLLKNSDALSSDMSNHYLNSVYNNQEDFKHSLNLY